MFTKLAEVKVSVYINNFWLVMFQQYKNRKITNKWKLTCDVYEHTPALKRYTTLFADFMKNC